MDKQNQRLEVRGSARRGRTPPQRRSCAILLTVSYLLLTCLSTSERRNSIKPKLDPFEFWVRGGKRSVSVCQQCLWVGGGLKQQKGS